MRLALAEADAAAAAGDVPVGAVVVDSRPDPTADQDIVVRARGHNAREAAHDPTAHAELIAIAVAARSIGDWRLIGRTLVVTLEPCAMCAGAAVSARLDRVVFGAYDEKAGAAGSVFDLLSDRRHNHRPEVVPGVLAGECGERLTTFFASRRR